MKKSIVLFFMAVLLLSSCVSTNPYTQKDYDEGKEVAKPGWSFLAMTVPGLPQLINGEYLEAAIYAGSVLVGAGIVALTGGIEAEEPTEGLEVPHLIGTALYSLSYTWSMADGVGSWYKRSNEYRRILENEMPFQVGMTYDELIKVKGRPRKINSTETKHGTSYQFIYGPTQIPTYVYLENGVVTAIQR